MTTFIDIPYSTNYSSDFVTNISIELRKKIRSSIHNDTTDTMIPLKLYSIVLVVLLLCRSTQLPHTYCCMRASYSQQFNVSAQSKGKYIGGPILYYHNSVSTYHVKLLSCGDIKPNPGPSGDDSASTLDIHRIQYTSEFLHSLNSGSTCKCEKWREDNTLAWGRILSLGIGRRLRTHRGKRGGRDGFEDHLKLCTINARSLRNKSTIFNDFVQDNKL